MLVSDIWEELKEATGSSDDAVNYKALNRAVQILGNKGLFDPNIGTVDFSITGGYLVSLPRDVKVPIRINIEENPSFPRSRLFEYSNSGPGSNDGAEVGWQWHTRGYSCVQDERTLPSVLTYVTDAGDTGKTITVYGFDSNGLEITEQLTGGAVSPTASVNTFERITRVVRESTIKSAVLSSISGSLARYYPDEIEPSYRVIKLSQTGVAIRMLYRRVHFNLSTQEDIIPLQSPFAVIRAVSAVRLALRQRYEEADIEMEAAVGLEREEQATKDEGTTISDSVEIASATNTNINTNDVLIVADVYDMAVSIFGGIGRAKIFDRITDAINLLGNKSRWDSMLGYVDLYKPDTSAVVMPNGRKGSGLFILPRYVSSVDSITLNDSPQIPRNRWFAYHINGTGQRNLSSAQTWSEAGDFPTQTGMPLGSDGRPLNQNLRAKCDDAGDEDIELRVFGFDSDGKWIIDENGAEGFLVPVKVAGTTESTISIARITRVSKAASKAFIRLYTGQTQLGYYYPDEVEPTYRGIFVASDKVTRISVKYRKRVNKVTGFHDVIQLRSRTAMENIMMALAEVGKDPDSYLKHEALAVQQLKEEQAAMNPHRGFTLSFDPNTSPAHTENFQ